MVVTPTCLAFRALITPARIWKKGFELKNSISWLYLPISSSVEKIFRNMLCQFFFAWADILSEKNRTLESIFFAKQTLIMRTSFVYKTGKNFSFNQCSYQERFAFFSRESYFIKAIENVFALFGLGEFSTVMQKLDFVSGLHNCLEFSQPLSCLY